MIMARLWQIRESFGERSPMEEMNRHDKAIYECGYEEGREDAMREMEMTHMGERRGRAGRMGERYPDMMDDRYPEMDDRYPEMDIRYPEMGERRRRRSNGRYM